MNCKPGDKAVIVSSLRQENIGAIVEVLRASKGNTVAAGVPYSECGSEWVRGSPWIWVIRSMGREILTEYGKGHIERPFGDRNLRPLPDLSEDAPDESAAWLPPVPSTQQVAA